MDGPADNSRPSLYLGEIVMAAGVIGLGVFFLLGAWSITVIPSYARIGPRFFPYIVGWGLIVTGLLLLWEALLPHGDVLTEEAEDWAAISWIVAGLGASALFMERLGYIPATTLLFILAARGLGERRYVRSALAGFGLALITYIAFTRLLDLHLPAGFLAPVF